MTSLTDLRKLAMEWDMVDVESEDLIALLDVIEKAREALRASLVWECVRGEEMTREKILNAMRLIDSLNKSDG